MGAAERISRDLELIRSEEFAVLCRTRPQDFTRRRKLPPDVLAESLLVRKGRTLYVELRDMRKAEGVDVTKQGYLKAREKMRPEALLELMRRHARAVYEDGDFVTWHGMVVVAVDGSTGDLPTNDRTLGAYGDASGTGTPQAIIGISSAYDPLSCQVLDISLDRGAFNERSKVVGHLLEAEAVTGGMPLLAVADRGYPSIEMLATLECGGAHYLFRCSKSFLCAEFRQAERAGGDLWVDVRITRKRLRHIKDQGIVEALVALGTIPVRFCIVDIGDGKTERLVTNLGADVLPHEDLKDGYWNRWPIETTYGFMKDQFQMENFTGTRPVLIEQDIYATGYLVNLAFDLAREAQREADERIERLGKRYRHEMAVNKTVLIGNLKSDLYEIILADDEDRDALMAALVEECSQVLVPVRPDRDPQPRDVDKSGKRALKYHNNRKRAF